ncbi:MAG: hypothetical protein QHH19_02460 [Candidatus Thermoplasmatota archaeon]|nr:hypothetical protein [Candidatus Thermoplasmatota archaeon]
MLAGISTIEGVSSIAQPRFPQLIIHAPSYVNESQPFFIQVTALNNSIPNAKVTITAYNYTYFTGYTNMNGTVIGYVYGINQTTVMTIKATKTGYKAVTKLITVINSNQNDSKK